MKFLQLSSLLLAAVAVKADENIAEKAAYWLDPANADKPVIAKGYFLNEETGRLRYVFSSVSVVVV